MQPFTPPPTEVCDGDDNDCNGTEDGAEAVDALTWYADIDGDGFGMATVTMMACVQPESFVADSTDCNDFSTAAHPGLDEVCDGIDNNCDDEIDEASAVDAPTWYKDQDDDGFGNPARTEVACDVPVDHVDNSLDCHDGDPAIHPDADEVCGDDIDNDCSGDVDGPDAVDAPSWHPDLDADGFGDEDAGVTACETPVEYISGTDCDDEVDVEEGGEEAEEEAGEGGEEEAGEGGEEEAGEGGEEEAEEGGEEGGEEGAEEAEEGAEEEDPVCMVLVDYMLDGTDCNDEDELVYPGADETWYDGIDSDCLGDSDFDQDGDGFELMTDEDPDCNDEDVRHLPGCGRAV